MSLSEGIVGLPNVGPARSLLSPEVYILASKEHSCGTALFGFENQKMGAIK